jgi:hypothetical protein
LKRIAPGETFPLSLTVKNINDMVTGLSVAYQIRDLNDSLILSGVMSESSNNSGHYYDSTSVSSAGIYVIVYIPPGYPIVTESIICSAGADLSEIQSDLKRLLGLSHENVYYDQPSYDANNNLISLRMRTYSVAGSVGTGNDVLATYLVTSTGDGAGKFTVWQQVKQ